MSKEKKNKEMLKLWEFIHRAEFESQMNSILRDVSKLHFLKAHQLITKGGPSIRKKE